MALRAHELDGVTIINTIEVESLDFKPNLIDASIGGGIGDSIVDGVLVQKPVIEPEPEPIESIRARVWEAIKAMRTAHKDGGVHVGGKWFHSDIDSRIQWTGLVIMGANIHPGLMWKTMDGSFVEMTRDLASDVFEAIAVLDQAAFARAEQHRVLMEASPTPAEYNFNTGWPAVYGG